MLEHSNWVVQFCFSAVFSYSCILLCSCILLRHSWWPERASRLQKYHCGQLSLRLPFFTLETWAPIFKASYENLSKQTSKEKLEINLKKVLILKNLKKNLGKVMKNLGNICDDLGKSWDASKSCPRAHWLARVHTLGGLVHCEERLHLFYCYHISLYAVRHVIVTLCFMTLWGPSFGLI